MNVDFSNFNDPRKQALNIMKQSVPESTWERNKSFTDALRLNLKQHPINTHPAIQSLNTDTISLDVLQSIHLDYRHAIVQIFTDALTMAMTQTRQLEPRLAPGSKLAPRFLLTLNALDEFGFIPRLDEDNYYSGNPRYAHYPLFEEVLTNLGIDSNMLSSFKPSEQAKTTLAWLEDCFDDYTSIVALLAVAELQVIIFSPPLRKAVENLGHDVNSGYYFVHGTSEDEDTAAADDDHEEDLWNALHQGCTEADHQRLETLANTYMDLWNAFWDTQLSRIESAKSNNTQSAESTAQQEELA